MIHQAGNGTFYTIPNLLVGSTPLSNGSENETRKYGLIIRQN